jgi:hypothetical protein
MTNPGNTPGGEQQHSDAGNVDKRRAEVRERKGRERGWQLTLERMRQRGGR